MRSVLFTWGGRSPVREQTQCLLVAVYRGKLRPRDTPHCAFVDRVNSASPHGAWHGRAIRPPLEWSWRRVWFTAVNCSTTVLFVHTFLRSQRACVYL